MFHGIPFRYEHMLALEPYLVDNDPSILVTLLGLLRDDFDEDSRFRLIEGIKKCDLWPVFGKAPAAADAPPPAAKANKFDVRVDELYYEVFNLFPWGLKESDKRDKLAFRWRYSINPIPQKGEISQELYALSTQYLEVPDGKSVTAPKYPAFEMTEKGYKILKKLVDDNRPNRLEEAVVEALQHSQTVPSVHLFGIDLENLESCDLKPIIINRTARVLEFANLDYYPPERLDILKAAFRTDDDINSAFADSPITRVDQEPLEETQFWRHVLSLGWPDKRLIDFCVLPERHLKAKIIAEAQASKAAYEQREADYTARRLPLSVLGPKPPLLRGYDPLSMKSKRLGTGSKAAKPSANTSFISCMKYKAFVDSVNAPIANIPLPPPPFSAAMEDERKSDGEDELKSNEEDEAAQNEWDIVADAAASAVENVMLTD